jgi:chemotaxis protein MotB
MALARARRGGGINYWPGFVDALTTLLLAIIFLLSVFVLGQFFLGQELTNRDTVLERLNRQIAELTDLLALERSGRRNLEGNVASLEATLRSGDEERGRLQGLIDSGGAAQTRANELNTALQAERQATARAQNAIELLNQQLAALRRQLAAVEEALSASENRDRESQARIADLGSRLNVALAQRVQELARYRSDFFGRLRQILGERPDVRIVGDRFVFQSEVLFAAGQAGLRPEALPEIDRVAAALLELDRQIPPDIPWIIRVDGHTDRRPITSSQFPSNWALSASRAIAVVQYLISKGVPAQRLAATGFGEFQPLDVGTTDEAYSRNRRIELKLTER